MFEYIDIHSHLDLPYYQNDLEEQIDAIKKANIATISVGTDLERSKSVVALAEKHNNIFACIGKHPEDLKVDSLFDEGFFELAKHPKVVAIGECGLDYFRPEEDSPEVSEEIKKIQKKVFEQHIDLSLEVEKPLMLHMRPQKGTMDAYTEGLDILENYAKKHGEKLRGNAHFFAGDMGILKRFLAIGFTVSFTGVMTFTHDYDELVRYAPLTSIMSETDSPFVAPVPYRGKPNTPLYVPEIVRAIARIRSQDFDLVKKTLVENAMRSFKI